jgi:hypothetical protein
MDDGVKKTRSHRERNVDRGPEIVPDLQRLGEWMTDIECPHSVLTHNHWRLQHLGELAQFGFGAENAAADKDRGIARLVEELGGARNCFQV